MDPALLALLRVDLLRANYTEESVRALLGDSADAARLRGSRAPARRVLKHADANALSSDAATLRTLVCLFLVGDPVSESELAASLPSLGVPGALGLGLVAADIDEQDFEGQDRAALRSALALSPFHATGPGFPASGTDWWLLSDLDDHIRRGPARPDHVMGVGGATRSLLGFAVPGRVGSALDLGTGCGVIALHLAARADRVVALDISLRAIEFAEANAQLNEVKGIELRQGDLFAPVVGERFDLILSNPPFVITPRGAGVPEYEYRDGGRAGDDLIAQVVQSAPTHLTPGGLLQCLGNWEVRWGADGLERVLEWVTAAPGITPADACWVIERDRQQPEGYAELWVRDGGARPGSEEFERLVAAWLDDFGRRHVIAIGLGLIGLRRAPSGSELYGPRRAEQANGDIGARLGDSWGETLAVATQLSALDSVGFGEQLLVRDDAVREERQYEPGAEDPMSIVIASDHGLTRRIHADTVLAAAVGACDGDLTVDEICGALTDILAADPVALRDALHEGLRELVWCGMLRPADTTVSSISAN